MGAIIDTAGPGRSGTIHRTHAEGGEELDCFTRWAGVDVVVDAYFAAQPSVKGEFFKIFVLRHYISLNEEY